MSDQGRFWRELPLLPCQDISKLVECLHDVIDCAACNRGPHVCTIPIFLQLAVITAIVHNDTADLVLMKLQFAGICASCHAAYMVQHH